MNDDQWKEIKNFNKKEAWGDPSKMDFSLRSKWCLIFQSL